MPWASQPAKPWASRDPSRFEDVVRLADPPRFAEQTLLVPQTQPAQWTELVSRRIDCRSRRLELWHSLPVTAKADPSLPPPTDADLCLSTFFAGRQPQGGKKGVTVDWQKLWWLVSLD